MNKKLLPGLISIVIVIGLLTLFLKKNNPAAHTDPSDKLHVITSFYPLYFLASEIAGDKADVTNITPAGAEPHDYEPTSRDMASIEHSDILILNGGGLEAWAEDVEKNINPEKTLIVEAGKDLMTEEIVEEGRPEGRTGGGEKIADPHVWLSPSLAQQMVGKIETGFVQKDPANAERYHAHAQILRTKLANLDAEYTQALSTCTEKNIITSHAAFGYLASTYNFTQVAITGVSPDAEPGAKELATIATFAKANNIKYIFFESLLSPKLSETIAKEVGATTLVLNPLEGLTDKEISEGKDYFTEMRSNLSNLKTALNCKP